MATYALTNGYRVKSTEQGNGSTEFQTTNPEGAVISTVYLRGDDAKDVTRDLIVAERLAAL